MNTQIQSINASSFNHAELRGAIKAAGFTEKNFAEMIGIDSATLSSFLNGKSSMRAVTIAKAAIILGVDLDSQRFQRLFFSLKN